MFNREQLTTGRLLLFVLLAWFYVEAASMHAATVNLSKARGDQSGYLWDAERVYANWHGDPGHLIGQRMRMPAYAAVLAFFYSPHLSAEQFFDVARRVNIWLSLVLLIVIGFVVERWLPPLIATNLLLVIAFGYFVFKAGYCQPELLSYGLLFLTFLAACVLLDRGVPGQRDVLLAAALGALAGATQMTKAVMPPFLALFAVLFVGQATLDRVRDAHAGQAARAFMRRLMAIALVGGGFLAIVSPYILHSRRTFGSYFYNANTAIFMWYDDGVTARAILMPHMDAEGRIAAPASALPDARSYWRTHTIRQVVERVGDGLRDIAVGSLRGYGFLKYAVWYALMAAAVILANRRAFARLLVEHAALSLFVVGYAVIYLTSTAFFSITSSTGDMRFFLAHVAPFFFTVSWLLARPPFRETRWSVGRARLSVLHLQLATSALIAVDLAFWLWPRLMTTYAGF